MQTGAPIYRSYREMTRLPRHHPDPAFSYFASYLSSPSVRFRENEETRVVQFLSVSRNTNSHVDDIKKYYKFTCFFNNNNEIDRFLLINRRMFVYLVQRRKSRLFLPNYDQKNRRNEANETRRRSNVSSILDVHSFPLPLPTIPSKKPYVSTDPIFILGRRKRVQDRDRQRKRERRAIRFEATQ